MFPNVVVRTVRRRLPTNCKYAEGSFTKQNANSLCVGRTLTARYLTQFERFVRLQCGNGSLAQQPNCGRLDASRIP